MKNAILLVSKDFEFHKKIKNTLEENGYEVLSSDNQKESENIIRKLKPDLAIFDLMLENEDSGFVLGYMCKKLYPKSQVIIAAPSSILTGVPYGYVDDEKRTWINADFLMNKEVSEENLMNIIENLLERSK